MNRLVTIAFVLVLFSCSTNVEEANTSEPLLLESKKGSFQTFSLLGDSLFAPVYVGNRLTKLDSNLREAYQNWYQDSTEMNTIWFGRRVAYFGRYNEAIEIFTKGLARYPESYKLYRHRGHRFISVREFDKAIEDFKRAAELMPKDRIEIEPDGMPNRMNTPLSSTQFNIWYHLGLAYYLSGDFENALESYKECLKVSVNDDLQSATVDWLYMTLRRLDKEEEATESLLAIHENMAIIENDSYFKRLMMYKGEMPIDSVLNVSENNPDIDLALATQGYGVGNWYLYNGDTTRAIDIYQKVVAGKHWSAFGYVAAEADLASLNP